MPGELLGASVPPWFTRSPLNVFTWSVPPVKLNRDELPEVLIVSAVRLPAERLIALPAVFQTRASPVELTFPPLMFSTPEPMAPVEVPPT